MNESNILLNKKRHEIIQLDKEILDKERTEQSILNKIYVTSNEIQSVKDKMNSNAKALHFYKAREKEVVLEIDLLKKHQFINASDHVNSKVEEYENILRKLSEIEAKLKGVEAEKTNIGIDIKEIKESLLSIRQELTKQEKDFYQNEKKLRHTEKSLKNAQEKEKIACENLELSQEEKYTAQSQFERDKQRELDAIAQHDAARNQAVSNVQSTVTPL